MQKSAECLMCRQYCEVESEVFLSLFSCSNLVRFLGSEEGALRLGFWSPAPETVSIRMAAFLPALLRSTPWARTRSPLHRTVDARAFAQGAPVTRVGRHSLLASSSVTAHSGPRHCGWEAHECPGLSFLLCKPGRQPHPAVSAAPRPLRGQHHTLGLPDPPPPPAGWGCQANLPRAPASSPQVWESWCPQGYPHPEGQEPSLPGHRWRVRGWNTFPAAPQKVLWDFSLVARCPSGGQPSPHVSTSSASLLPWPVFQGCSLGPLPK